MLVVFLVVFHYYQKQNPAEELAFKASRVDLVNRVQLALASASEAEKSAVLAITDQDSQTFAEQARAASAEVEWECQDLGKLLASGGTQSEKELFDQFTRLFNELQHIDKDLLNLAVQNTNLKASALTFGDASTAINTMNAALSSLIASNSGSPEESQIMSLGYGTEISVLRIQTLLPPHIAEESNQKMDELESQMAKEDTQIRKNLDKLMGIAKLRQNADLTKAISSYAQFSQIKTRILALSRENTNVRSLSIALNQKRKAMFLCQDTLNKLQQAILDEPIKGVTYGHPARPRKL